MSTKKIQILGGLPQSNWNQNDETAVDYIKNRPFYEKEAEPLFESNIAFNNYDSAPVDTINLEIDKEYKVIVDGTEYTATCFFDDTESKPCLRILDNEGNILWVYQNWMAYKDGTYALKIIDPTATEVKQMEGKFVKDMYYEQEAEPLFEGEITANDPYGFYNFAENLPITEDTTYLVTYDGIEYVGTSVFDADETCWTIRVPMGGGTTLSIYNYGFYIGDETHTLKIIDPSATIIKQVDPKYIKDMYWEEEPQEVVLVPETTVEITGNNFIERAIDITLVEGTTYTVIWNGTKYECTCYNYDGALVIGNNSCWGGSSGNGEPFLISNYNGLTAINIYEEGTYTVSITAIISKIHYLDPKYIKDMYHEYMAPNNDTVIWEQAISTDSDYSYVDVGIDSFLVEGASYIVNWNGTEYTCIARNDAWGNLYIGNQAIGVEVDGWEFPETIESNEPFFLFTNEADDAWGFVAQTAGEYTVSVVGTGEKLTPYKIDMKYMPDEVVENIDELWYEVDNVYNNINNVRNTANTAKTNAATAQTAANKAQTTANTANTTANSAKTLATDNAAKMLTYVTGNTEIPQGRSWYSVTYGDNKFIATSQTYNYVAVSTDGYSWKQNSAIRAHSSAHGNGKFVITGVGGIYYSADGGLTWNKATGGANMSAVTYGSGKFVAVGGFNSSESVTNSSQVAYSDDGINWTLVSSVLASNAWQSVTYGNGRFVTVGSSRGYISYSDDGITWSHTGAGATFLSTLMSVTYGNGKFVAVGRDNIVVYSEDGVNWIQASLPTSNTSNFYTSVTFANGKFVAIARSSSSSLAIYSEDGINWLQTSLPTSSGANSWYSVTYGNDMFVVVGSSAVAYSKDGITWLNTYTQIQQNSSDVTDAVKAVLDITDPTLSIEDAAADAKAVGEALSTKITSPSTAEVGQTIVVKSVDASGRPTEWEAADTVKSWNQLEDKPFDETEIETIFDGDIVLEDGYCDIELSAPLVSGDTYKLLFDGVERREKAITDINDEVLVNFRISGTVFTIGNDFAEFEDDSIDGKHTVKINHLYIKQIEQKFVPNVVFEPVYFMLQFGVVTCAKTFEELKENPNGKIYVGIFKPFGDINQTPSFVTNETDTSITFSVFPDGGTGYIVYNDNHVEVVQS